MMTLQPFLDPVISFQTVPFRHFHVPKLVTKGLEDRIVEQLSNCTEWKLRVEDNFYEVFDLERAEARRLSALVEVSSIASRDYLRALMERAFTVELEDRVEFFAQKMVKGFRNRVHNDWGPRAQTHRLVIQLNQGWSVRNGGLLMLFDEERPEVHKATHRHYVPTSGSAVGFEISQSSYHAVSPVEAGTRFTLVYSFFERATCPRL